MIRLLVFSMLAVGDVVVPCGSALCIGGNQQPITLGGTIQVSQGYIPDGGIALFSPVVAGARIEMRGTQSDPNDGGATVTPNVVLGSRNSMTGTDVLVSVKSNQVEVARFSINASFARFLDGGTQTATVPLNTNCVCNDVSDTTKGVKAPVSSTTATISGTSGDTVQCVCL